MDQDGCPLWPNRAVVGRVPRLNGTTLSPIVLLEPLGLWPKDCLWPGLCQDLTTPSAWWQSHWRLHGPGKCLPDPHHPQATPSPFLGNCGMCVRANGHVLGTGNASNYCGRAWGVHLGFVFVFGVGAAGGWVVAMVQGGGSQRLPWDGLSPPLKSHGWHCRTPFGPRLEFQRGREQPTHC